MSAPSLSSPPSPKSPLERLLRACEEGNFYSAVSAIEDGADVNGRMSFPILPFSAGVEEACAHGADDLDVSPLKVATLRGHATVVSLLLANDAVVDDEDFASVIDLLDHSSPSGSLEDSPAPASLKEYPVLHLACKYGREDIVYNLLGGKTGPILHALVNRLDRHGTSALTVACKHEQKGIVALLLANGAMVNHFYPDDRACLPLHAVHANTDTDILQMLLVAGADVNLLLPWLDDTALHRACRSDNTAAASLLLSAPNASDSLNLSDINGTSAIIIACERGNKDLVGILIAAGADVHDCEFGHQTTTPIVALCRASGGRGDCSTRREILAMLLSAGADVNAPSHEWSILHGILSQSTQEENILCPDLNLIGDLIAAGADIFAYDHRYLTPLHYAVDSNFVEIARLLLQSHADAHSVYDEENYTPLHVACINNSVECVRLLVQSGADIFAQDDHDCTPLHNACEHDNVECARLLLEFDSSAAHILAIDDDDDHTPLHSACKYNSVECARLLLECNLSLSAALIVAVDGEGLTPLHYACKYNSVECALLLMLAGADPDDATIGSCGATALELAGTEETRAAVSAYMPTRADALTALRHIHEATGLLPDVANQVVVHGIVQRSDRHFDLVPEYFKNRDSGLYDVEDAGGGGEAGPGGNGGGGGEGAGEAKGDGEEEGSESDCFAIMNETDWRRELSSKGDVKNNEGEKKGEEGDDDDEPVHNKKRRLG
jgi:ankyrin repeat protein